MNFKKIKSTTEDLDELYKDNSFTFEGLSDDEENLKQLVEYLKDYFKDDLEEVDIYDTSGELMNDYYNLTGSNRYPNNLTIISIKLSNFKNIGELAMLKIKIGARWFNDIVDNNMKREK